MIGNYCYRVGEWLVDPSLDRISHGDVHVRLRPLVMDLLVLLVENRGQLVSLEDMIDTVWQGKAVTSGSVYNSLNELRSAFGDDPHSPTYILTVPKRGYCMVASIKDLHGSSTTGLNPE